MAGELSWLERGTHKPEVSGSIPLPATNLKDIFNQLVILVKIDNEGEFSVIIKMLFKFSEN